jgi:hypothetical protein
MAYQQGSFQMFYGQYPGSEFLQTVDYSTCSDAAVTQRSIEIIPKGQFFKLHLTHYAAFLRLKTQSQTRFKPFF